MKVFSTLKFSKERKPIEQINDGQINDDDDDNDDDEDRQIDDR